MKTRIYHPAALNTGTTVTLDDNAGGHVTRVLRLRQGDTISVFNEDGVDYRATIESAVRQSVTVTIGQGTAVHTESPLKVTLFQGICRSQKMDLLIQKSTELGVHTIVPIVCQRSVVRIDQSRYQKKMEHWRKIAIGATEQSGRTFVPIIEPPIGLNDALNGAPSGGIKIMLNPESQVSLVSMLENPQSVTLLVGPEGGLTEAEVSAAIAANFRGCRLGPRILRTETAPIAALSIIQCLAGDLNSIT